MRVGAMALAARGGRRRASAVPGSCVWADPGLARPARAGGAARGGAWQLRAPRYTLMEIVLSGGSGG